MSAACRPHKPGFPGKPDRCPTCQQPYAFRVRPPDDVFRTAGYRHTAGGWIYVHHDPEWPTGVLSL